ncbi:MAG: replication initiation factor domain-containing protein [Candidatus Cloacimonetes bacterium]|nr:replication initiation factor domain-containing protein [Candidatus Cloacimonadota bacterium]
MRANPQFTNKEMYREPRCLIDKVRILGNLRPEINFSELISGCDSYVENQWDSHRGKLLKKHIKFSSGAYMEYTQHSIGKPEIQFDFNPNNSNKNEYSFCLSQMQNKRLSYVEIAVDYNLDLSEFIWFDVSNRKSSITYINSFRRLETIYFGSRESKMQYVIYNKNLEQKNNAATPWWRVEVKLRIKKNDYPETTYGFMPDNLFISLRGVNVPDGNAEDYAKYLYFACFQTEIDKLSRYRRDKLLSLPQRRGEFKQPWIVCDENIGSIKKTIASWLSTT